MARYQQLRESGFVEEDGTKVNNVAKALSTVGIEIIDQEGNFRNFGNVMDELGAKWGELENREKAYIATALSGSHQQARFLNLMEGYAESVDLYNGALNSAGSTQVKYNVWLESTEAHMNTLKATTEELWINLFDSDLMKDGIDSLTTIVSWIGKIVDTMGGLPSLITLVATSAMLLGRNLRAIRVDAETGNFSGWLIKMFTGFGLASGGAKGLEVAILGIKRAIGGILSLGVSVAIGYLTSMLTTKLMSALAGVDNKLSDIRRNINEAHQSVSNNNNNIQQLVNLSDEYDKLANKTNRTNEEQKRFHEISNNIARISPEVVKGYDAQGNAMVELTNGTKGLIEALKEKNRIEFSGIVNTGEDSYNTYLKKIKDIRAELKSAKEEISLINTGEGFDVRFNDRTEATILGLKNLKEAYAELTDEQREAYGDIWVAEIKKGEAKIQGINESIEQQQSNIKSVNKEIDVLTQAILGSSVAFTSLDSNAQKFITSLTEGMDYSKYSWDELKTHIKGIAEAMSDTDNIKLYEYIVKLNNSFIDNEISAEQYETRLNALGKSLADNLGISVEKVNELLRISEDKIKKVVSEISDYETILKDVAKQMNETSGDIKTINELLKKHSEDDVWDTEAIMKLAEEHPKLLTLLDDEIALEQELIKIKNDKTNAVSDSYSVQLKIAQNFIQTYVDSLADGYKIDFENFVEVQKAKSDIMNKLAKQIEAQEKQLLANMAIYGYSGGGTSKQYEDLKKLREQYEQLGKAFDSVIELKRFDANMREFFDSLGDKDDKKKDDKDYKVELEATSKYQSKLDDLNNSLKKQDDIISSINSKITYYKELGDNESMKKAISETNNLYEQQNNRLNILKTNLSSMSSQRNAIANEFKAKWSSMKNVDISKWMKTDFDNMFAKLFPTMTTKDETVAEKYKADKELFESLVNDWFAYGDAITSTNLQITDVETQKLNTIRDEYDIYFQLVENGHKNLIKGVEDAKKAYEDLDENASFDTQFDSLEGLTEAIINYKNSIKTTISDLEAKRDKLTKNGYEWSIINNEVDKYKGLLNETNSQLDDTIDKVEQIREKQLSVATSLQDKIVGALREKYDKAKKDELEAVTKKYESELENKQNEVDRLRRELKALQDETNEKKDQLGALKKERELWAKDDSAYARSKVAQLDKQIKEKQKEIDIDMKQQEIETAESSLEATKTIIENEKKAIEDKYADMLEEGNLYKEAMLLLTTGTQDEILKLLLEYDERYASLGTALGGAYADAFITEIERAKDALAEINKQETKESQYLKNNPDVAKALQTGYDSKGNKINFSSGYEHWLRFGEKEGRKFDTGGYTGEWGSSGKLAVLHQKERVLTPQQTKAFDNLVYTIIPKINMLEYAKQKPTSVFNAPVVKNDISIINNTPFDVGNNMDNLNKAIKQELKLGGYRMGL